MNQNAIIGIEFWVCMYVQFYVCIVSYKDMLNELNLKDLQYI